MGPDQNTERNPRTLFMQQTLKRAVPPRWIERAQQLSQLEELIYSGEYGCLGAPRGFLLNAFARRYPVSTRAMQWEIRWGDQATPAELAELIELGLRGGPPRSVLDRGRR